MKKILITGIAGFIGYHLAEKLLNNNYHIIGIDNLNDYYDPTLKKARLNNLNKFSNFEFQKIDFIQKKPPKSTGRHEFGRELVNDIILSFSQVSPNDMIRTFCAFTARSIAENLNKFLNFKLSNIRLIVSGGGVHHPVLMEDIRKYTGISNLKTADEYGISSDTKEALLMAVLGTARIQKLPANMPSVTGAEKMVVLGDVLI